MPTVKEISDENTLVTGLEDEDDYTDTDSAISGDDDFDPQSESLADRIFALRDIFPPRQRRLLVAAQRNFRSWISGALLMGGKTSYVIASSALLLGVPLALAILDEQQVIAMEKEMKLQQGANEVLAPGAASQLSQKYF